MKCYIVTAGVGGQGVLSIAGIIASSALRAGHQVSQAEVHGMSQRGGAVVAHLRISDSPIHSTTIPRGSADLVIAMEQIEALRYVEYFSESTTLLCSTERVVNIPDYPDVDPIVTAMRRLPRTALVDADRIARDAGSARAANVVMVGAAVDLLPFDAEIVRELIREVFADKGDKVVRINLDAFEAGRAAVGGTGG
jgi:indolepyruvate ferredoxin oxidoreductase beta subunit